MHVLVAGGDGFIGRELVAELVDRGHDVRAMARDPDPTVLPDAAETVVGDVTDADDVHGAVEGTDAVVNLVALSPLFEPKRGNEEHDRIHRGGTERLVTAAEDHDVDRFVQMSALGADPDGTTHYIRAKGRADEIVRQRGVEHVIVQPSVVFGEDGEFVSFTKLLTTPYITGLPGGGRSRFQPIYRGDLVPMLADAVTEDEHADQTYEIGGPAKLTLAEIAKKIYRSEGKSLRVLPVPMIFAKVGLSLATHVPGVPMGPDQYRSLQFDNVTEHNDVGAFGVDPDDLRTIDDYLGLA